MSGSAITLVVFGLAISSSWGNGHATLWRGLCGALARRGHRVIFFEHDVPYYAEHRDLTAVPGGELILYRDWAEVRGRAARALSDADAGIVTSFCPHGIEATALLLNAARPVKAFYDLDTPVTLARLAAGEPTTWIGPGGLAGFDIVFSFTGGEALRELSRSLGARRVVPLYGSVDPAVHHPAAPDPAFRGDLSFLGTYAADRQAALQTLFLVPASRLPQRRFVIAGSLYPADFPWLGNVYFLRHLAAGEHARLFASSRLTLNITRSVMGSMGYCPSGRLFEAAACGVPILSDYWAGLDHFYQPGREILIAAESDDAVAAIERDDAELRRIAAAARERTLAQHTADQRARELIAALDAAAAAPAPLVGAA
jgi:spore maturation protein CgeB